MPLQVGLPAWEAFLTSHSKPRVSPAHTRGYHWHLCPLRTGGQGLGGLEEVSRGKVGRAGRGQSLAQLTSLVQNPTGAGEGWWWAGWAPRSQLIPGLELVPFSSSQTSEMSSVEGRRGCREGPIPSHQEPGQTQRLGKQAR